LLLAILVGVAVLAPDVFGDNARGGCARGDSCVPRLPAPIRLAAGDVIGSVSFIIERDRRVRRIPDPQSHSRFPQNAFWFPGTGTWFRIRHGHLIVGRGRKPVWRSHGDFTSRWQFGVVTVGSQTVAFQHDHELYLASVSGAERPVARAELPLGWTRGGLYTYRYQGRELLLRSDSGALLKVIARRSLGSDDVVANGSLYFISHGVLMSARGARIQRLATLASLGLSAGPWLQSLGRLLELQESNRVVVLRPDGSVFAWTPLPRSQGGPESISSSLVVAPDGSAVAFAAAAGESNDPDATRQAQGTETVFVLRPGARKAVPVHTERVDFKVCERGASLEWHGKWVLYSNSEGNLAAIDTTGVHHAIELSSLVRGLAGTRDGFSVSWTGQPFEL
jgi:hypothetical protein